MRFLNKRIPIEGIFERIVSFCSLFCKRKKASVYFFSLSRNGYQLLRFLDHVLRAPASHARYNSETCAGEQLISLNRGEGYCPGVEYSNSFLISPPSPSLFLFFPTLQRSLEECLPGRGPVLVQGRWTEIVIEDRPLSNTEGQGERRAQSTRNSSDEF